MFDNFAFSWYIFSTVRNTEYDSTNKRALFSDRVRRDNLANLHNYTNQIMQTVQAEYVSANDEEQR